MSHTETDQELNASFTGFRSGPNVVPLPEKKLSAPGFEYAEHAFLGDHVNLQGVPPNPSPHVFTLPSGLQLTYGQICALAGDFYGTSNPISDGKDLNDQIARFMAAYNLLAEPSTWIQKDAGQILEALQNEVNEVNAAVIGGQDPSVAYSKLPDINLALNNITLSRPIGVPGYLMLASYNWDHFGFDAHTAYTAGHTAALQCAVAGDLERAYTMNAFADHFVGDMFAAGHLRTPRRYLHGAVNKSYDYCAKGMHDEDNAIGLNCVNSAGWQWTAYGDKRLLDSVNTANRLYVMQAISGSAQEIWGAYLQKKVPAVKDWVVWSWAPDLTKVQTSVQTLAPLFWPQDGSQRRSALDDRRTYDYTKVWVALTTANFIMNSGWWAYPITMTGPPKPPAEHPSRIAQLKRIEEYEKEAQGGVTNGVSNGNTNGAK